MTLSNASSSENTVEPERDVVVIGAGISGLVTARRLVGKPLHGRRTGARDRVGGRTWCRRSTASSSRSVGGGSPPIQDALKALLRELGRRPFRATGTATPSTSAATENAESSAAASRSPTPRNNRSS